MEAIKETDAGNLSDSSDDWTLLSPSRGVPPTTEQSESSTSNIQSEHPESKIVQGDRIDDGLTEIDLGQESKGAESLESGSEGQPSEQSEEGFRAIDTSSDEENEKDLEDGEKDLEAKSGGETEPYSAGSVYDRGDDHEGGENRNASDSISTEYCHAATSTDPLVDRSEHQDRERTASPLAFKSPSEKTVVAERERGFTIGQQVEVEDRGICEEIYCMLFCILLNIIITSLIVGLFWCVESYFRVPKPANDWPNLNEKSNEINLLHSELEQCIKRQSPSSYKYYMSDDYQDQPDPNSNPKPGSNPKAHRGLVCYGQEAQWRQRLEQLESEHGLELRNLIEKARRRATQEVLKKKYPNLKFELILNQIDYLNFLEDKRNKRHFDETLKYFKLENLRLLRRFSKPDETSHQKLLVKLELENAKLQRENEALRASISEKAGTAYMKQSVELENYERENAILKQFHHEVAQEVSKRLRQFNLHTIDAFTILDDYESLAPRLSLTRGYLRRLGDKMSTILIENSSLREELRRYSAANGSDEQNLTTSYDLQHPSRQNEHSDGLILDGCAESLREISARSLLLEEEVERLKRECGQYNSQLGRVSERELNQTSPEKSRERSNLLESSRQIDSPETALEKSIEASLSNKNEQDIIDDVIVFLNKFNKQIETDRLVTSDGADDSKFNADSCPAGVEEGCEAIIMPIVRTTSMILGHITDGILDLYGFGDSTPEREQEGANDAPPALLNYDQNSVNRPDTLQPEKIKTDHTAVKGTESANDFCDKQINPDLGLPNSPDNWFFRRAKQRKQLRLDEKDLHLDWVMKRAKLREKLRKASTYIEEKASRNPKKSSPAESRYHHKLPAGKRSHTGRTNCETNQRKSQRDQRHRNYNARHHHDEL